MLFDSRAFWSHFLILILVLVAVYVIINIFVIPKLTKQSDKRNKLTNLLLIVFFVTLFAIIYADFPKEPQGIDTFFFVQTLADVVLDFCVLGLATTGIVLIFKTSITTNFSQGMIATVGAFVGAQIVFDILAKYGNTVSALGVVLLAMLGSTVTAFLIGMAIDVFIIRKGKRVTSIGKQMITMGLVLVFSGLIPVVFGALPLEVPRLMNGSFTLLLFQQHITIPKHAVYALVITVVLLTSLFLALRLTKWGLGVRATASNEIVAGMMGVNTRVITAMSWAIAGALGGVSAIILAPIGGQVTVTLMTQTQVNGFMASILGGFSSFGGPLVGSLLIPLLSKLLYYFSGVWQNTVVYLFILLIVLVKPLGLFGRQIAKKV